MTTQGVLTKIFTSINLENVRDLGETLTQAIFCLKGDEILLHLQDHNFNPLASGDFPSKYSKGTTGRVTHYFEVLILYSNGQIFII